MKKYILTKDNAEKTADVLRILLEHLRADYKEKENKEDEDAAAQRAMLMAFTDATIALMMVPDEGIEIDLDELNGEINEDDISEEK